MKAFYTRLVAPDSGQRDAARALQGAMRAMIADGHAVHWAAFVAYGLWSWESSDAPRAARPIEPKRECGPEDSFTRVPTLEEALVEAKIPAKYVAPCLARLKEEGLGTLQALINAGPEIVNLEQLKAWGFSRINANRLLLLLDKHTGDSRAATARFAKCA